MKKFAIALALFAFVGTSVSSYAGNGDDKNKKECSTEKKSCCKSKSGAKACGPKAEGDKAQAATTTQDANTTTKAEVKKEETKK